MMVFTENHKQEEETLQSVVTKHKYTKNIVLTKSFKQREWYISTGKQYLWAVITLGQHWNGICNC